MTHKRAHRWVCIAVGLGALSFSASGAAQTAPPSTEADQPPPLVCSATCTCECDCNCREGIIKVTPYKNLILFNFGSTLAGRLEVEYERALHRLVSIFGAAYIVAFDSVGNQNLVGLGALVGGRVYMLGGAPEGLWLAWEVGSVYRNARRNRDIKLIGPQTGGMLGYTGVWGRFALTFGAGVQFAYGRLTVEGRSVTDKDVEPWFKFGMGVAF